MRYFVFLLSVFYLAITNAQSTPLLASLEVELSEGQTLPLANIISFELLSLKPAESAKSLLNWQNISATQIDDETLLVTMRGTPKFSGEVSAQDTANSFVVDINEESTKRFVSGFVNEVKQPWKLDQLVAYVNRYIQKPTYIHGFNIASVVATQGSGDCTEYAVLTAALARSLDMPARVVIGTVVIEDNKQVTAFGHAWTEVWQDQTWHILDAALYGSEAVQHFYLPAAALENEGPGYAMSLVSATNLMPLKIRNLANVLP